MTPRMRLLPEYSPSDVAWTPAETADAREDNSTGQAEPARAGIGGERHSRQAEPVSPELALIDPDLARRHRALLPEVLTVDRERRRPSAAAAAPDGRHGTIAPVQPPAIPVPARSRSTGRRLLVRAALLALLAAAAVAGVAAASLVRPGDRPRLLPLPAEANQATSESTGRSRPERTTTGRAEPAPQTPTARRRENTRARTAETRSAPSRPRPAGAGAEPRTFAWLAVPRASHYRVEFYRGRQRIFRAFPARPRIVVPGRWSYRGRTSSFAPGTYRWTVRPGFGPRGRARYGPPVVASKWVLQE